MLTLESLNNSPTILQPLYRATCVNRHLQLRTGGFCCWKVLLPACPCWWRTASKNMVSRSPSCTSDFMISRYKITKAKQQIPYINFFGFLFSHKALCCALYTNHQLPNSCNNSSANNINFQQCILVTFTVSILVSVTVLHQLTAKFRLQQCRVSTHRVHTLLVTKKSMTFPGHQKHFFRTLS